MSGNAQFLRRLRITTIAATLLQLGAVGAHAQMPGFEAHYKVHYGVLRGAMSLELERRGVNYVYRTSLRPRGFASWLRRGEIRETSVLVFVDGQVRPKDYTSTDTISRPNRHTRYVFDRSSGRVTGQYKSRSVDAPLRPDGQDRISAQIAVMRALQSDGRLDKIAVFDRGRWRDFEFEVLPSRTIDTPSGRFDAVEVRYTSIKKNKSWSLHCAEALNYLPVMIVYREDGKVKSRAELTEYRIPG